MANLLAKYGISAEREKEMWRQQNIADLRYWAGLSLTQKIQMLEDMEEVAKSMHGGKLPPRIGEEPAPFPAKSHDAR